MKQRQHSRINTKIETISITMYSISLLGYGLLPFACIFLLIITITRLWFKNDSNIAMSDTRLRSTETLCSKFSILGVKKRLATVLQILEHYFQLDSPRKGSSSPSTQTASQKHHGLLEGLGNISHILCVVVYGKTQLFITFRRQLIKSMRLPRLIRYESSQSQGAAVNEVTKYDRDMSRYGEARETLAQDQPRFQHIDCSQNSQPRDDLRVNSKRQVVISHSPTPDSYTPSRRKTCFPRRQMTERIRYPHFDLDSKVLSLPPMRNHDLGSRRLVLVPSQRQDRGLRA